MKKVLYLTFILLLFHQYTLAEECFSQRHLGYIYERAKTFEQKGDSLNALLSLYTVRLCRYGCDKNGVDVHMMSVIDRAINKHESELIEQCSKRGYLLKRQFKYNYWIQGINFREWLKIALAANGKNDVLTALEFFCTLETVHFADRIPDKEKRSQTKDFIYKIIDYYEKGLNEKCGEKGEYVKIERHFWLGSPGMN